MTRSAAVLAFGCALAFACTGPKGEPGPQGPPGEQGPQGAAGQPAALVVSGRPATPQSNVLLFNTSNGNLELYDGSEWKVWRPHVHASCAQILSENPGSPDGAYTIQPGFGHALVRVYCDMTTQGGGWTLVSYGYRAVAGGANSYALPNALTSGWDPIGRANIGAFDASQLVKSSKQAGLTTHEGVLNTGNMLSYSKAYVWNIPNPSATSFDLQDPVSSAANQNCLAVSVSELRAGSNFNALTIWNKLQVSCSGHKAGSPYERQFLGFNSSVCYGVCGNDPVTSNGMVVWYGSGATPTTSGGLGNPERAGSFGFWLR